MPPRSDWPAIPDVAHVSARGRARGGPLACANMGTWACKLCTPLSPYARMPLSLYGQPWGSCKGGQGHVSTARRIWANGTQRALTAGQSSFRVIAVVCLCRNPGGAHIMMSISRDIRLRLLPVDTHNGLPPLSHTLQGGGDLLAREISGGGFVFQIGAEPPPPRNFLRNPSHLLLPGSAGPPPRQSQCCGCSPFRGGAERWVIASGAQECG